MASALTPPEKSQQNVKVNICEDYEETSFIEKIYTPL